MRNNVEFKTADGTTLRGWHYLPSGRAGPAPIIVMAHGIAATKEMRLDAYAQVFADAGFGVLVYDHRNLGASDGEPRQEIDPWAQVRDFRDAITFAETLPQADPANIGIWGSSFSGGLVLIVSAFDRRVKCVSAQVPVISGSENIRRMVRPDHLKALRLSFDEDRRNRARGEAPAMIPVCDENPQAPSVLPTADSWQWFSSMARQCLPTWNRNITLRSAEMLSEYEPGLYISKISPTPLQMIVDTQDLLCPADTAFEAYERAGHPKNLVLLNGGHFTPYIEDFVPSSTAAREWFVKHLMV